MSPRRQTTPTRTSGIRRLLEIVAILRGQKGCPWDRRQTLRTLRPQLLEEAYEVLDALQSGRVDHHAEELGDLLLQVVMQARVREEQGHFNFDQVARRISAKLVHRHPHVFGRLRLRGAEQVLRNWERIKARERHEAGQSILDGVPRGLPALLRAQRIQGKVARVGFEWERVADVVLKVEEEWRELREAMSRRRARAIREEFGDFLFALVNLSRFLKVDAEDSLQAANAKFIKRFRKVEQRIRARGGNLSDSTLAEMDAEWNRVKREERRPSGRRRRVR